MRLSDYLVQHDLTLADFAKRIGVSVEAVRRYRLGARVPRPKHMAQIKVATAGAVTADDFTPPPEAVQSEAAA